MKNPSHVVNRRFFLRAAGISLALPLLESLSPRVLGAGLGVASKAGAAIGAVTGGSPLTGALIGGGIGAVGGAVTSGNDVNLGKPVWR